MSATETPTLVKAIRNYFEIPASDTVREFKALTEKDKQDFVQMFADIGIEVVRPS